MKKFSLLLLFFTLILQSCGSVPRFTSDKSNGGSSSPATSETAEKTESRSDVSDLSAIKTVYGVASYYGEKYNGRRTSSGEIFHMNSLTAAHRDYPFGTIVKVTNLANGKTVLVKINDRGPLVDGRIIDLSYGAAKILDMLKSGTAKVRIDILKWGDTGK